MSDNFLRALAVLSTREVSRLPHNSCSISLADPADRDEREGVGSIEVLNEKASSSRVELISALSRLKGFSIRSSNFCRRADNDGMVAFSLTRESWKSVDTLTSCKLDKEGMENWGIEMLTPIRLVADLYMSSDHLSRKLWVAHVQLGYGVLDEPVCRRDIILDIRPGSVETGSNPIRDLY